MSLLLFSLQNAFRKKTVAVLVVLAIGLGYALMTFLFSISSGIEKRLGSTFNEVSGQIIISGRDAIFGGMLMGMGTSTIPSDYLKKVKETPHIAEAYGQVSVILRPKGTNAIIPLFGYEESVIKKSAAGPFKYIIKGSPPGSADEVIIGKSLQEYMGLLNVPYNIGGVYRFAVQAGDNRIGSKELKVVGVYQSGNEVLDGGFSGRETLARDIGNIKDGRYSAIIARVDNLDNVEKAVQEVSSELAGEKPLQITVSRELLVPLKGLLNNLNNFFLAVSLVAVVTGGLSIFVVMLLSVTERKQEFGLLKALGWKPKHVIFMVITESVYLSLLGAAVGVALGYAALLTAMQYIAIDIVSFNRQVVLIIGAYGMLVGVAGGLYPAWRANSSSPAEIMRSV